MPDSSFVVAHVLRHPDQSVEEACADALVLHGIDPDAAATTATAWADRVVTESVEFLDSSLECLVLLSRILKDRGDADTADALTRLRKELNAHASMLRVESLSVN